MKKNERGAGLLEIVILSGILLFVIQTMIQSFSNFMSYQKSVEVEMSSHFLKNFVNQSVDCETTVAKLDNSCNHGEKIELTSHLGDPLIRIGSESANNFSTIGKFQVRAICKKCKKCNESQKLAIKIEARLLNNNNVVINHPIYKNKDWFPVYNQNPFKCII